MTVSPDVTVAVLTYRRPALLRRCLASVADQSGPGARFGVVVIDNDDEPSALDAVDEFAATAQFPVAYVHEARPGIAAARNAALAAAAATSADFLAFIDDDETAEPGWLSNLMRVMADSGCDVVQGSVLSILETGGPAWASRSLYERQVPLADSRLKSAASGNVLLRLASLDLLDEYFRDGFGLSGGEDTDFFCRLVKAGGTICAAPESKVVEVVPVARQSLRWLVKRAFRSSAVWSRLQREVIQEPMWLPRRLASAARDVGRAVGLLISGLATLNASRGVRGSCRLARAAGTVAGLFGVSLQEYGRK